jgi:mono/diheme cytochrome c family protein
MCVECHTPRDEQGSLLEDQLFEGAPIPVQAPPWAESWAVKSANLIVLAESEPERVASVLQTGLRPDGTRPMRPMPPFRLSADDTKAIVAYLRSLPKR